MSKMVRLPPPILKELEGLDWEIEHGKKHWLIRISGKLVAIYPRAPTRDWGRHSVMLRADIRQWKRMHA